MALFNLTNISFTPPGSGSGPLAPLLTEDKKYARNTYRYPSDLGSSDKAHYMVININEQRLTSFSGEGTGDTPQAIRNNINNGSFAAGTNNQLANLGNALNQAGNFVGNTPLASSVGGTVKQVLDSASATDKYIKAGADVLREGVNAFVDLAKQTTQRLQTGSIRAEKRITDTVALYMPDTLAFTEAQTFDELRPGGTLAAGVLSAGKSAIDSILQGQNAGAIAKEVVGQVSPFILSGLAKQAGGIFQVAFSQAFGVVQNPMLELIYSSPSLRTFRFDFQFYPRDEKEAKEVQDIIQRLRFHQAPEVAQGGSNGFFLVPPSEFDISFYYNGRINPNIPKISTCVLTSMDVDYAPGGFSSYEIPGENATVGGTGMPVSIRLSLQFKETEIMTKSSIRADRLSSQTVSNFSDPGYNNAGPDGKATF
jgi:hypothetical protein